MEELSNWFWNADFWLPVNMTWSDFESNDPNMRLATASDLRIIPFLTVLIIMVRAIVETCIAAPIGRMYALKDNANSIPAPNSILELAYKKYRKILPHDSASLEKITNDSGLTQRQIERWWRKRKLVGKPSELSRFCETLWRLMFYFGIFLYGLYTLWDKSWFTNTRDAWIGWPRQHVSDDLWWYYMVEISFYVSLVVSSFRDVKRSDFWEMMIHHAATLVLLCGSFCITSIRIGSLIMLIHDSGDYWLEAAKLARYLKYQKTCDFLFLMFTVVWFVTRICLLPYRITWSCHYESWEIMGAYRSWYMFMPMMYTLQVLHIIWFGIILRMLFAYVIKGDQAKDIRSDDEQSDADEVNDWDKKNGISADGNANIDFQTEHTSSDYSELTHRNVAAGKS